MIEVIEDYRNQRSFPLTLIISLPVNIKTVIRLMQTVEKKNSVKDKLFLHFTKVLYDSYDI